MFDYNVFRVGPKMKIFRFFIITYLHILLFISTVVSQRRRCPSDDLPSAINCGPHFKCPKNYYCYDGSCCPNCVKHNELNHKPQQQRSCDPDGTYSAVQCDNRSNVCWCCTPQGKTLKGTMARAEKFRMRNVTCDDYRLHSEDEFSDQKIFDDYNSRAFTLSDRDECYSVKNLGANCTSTCDKDRDCDSRKCCFTGCSYRCLEDKNAVRQDATGTSSLSRCPNLSQLSMALLSQAATCQVNDDCSSFLICCPTFMGNKCLMDGFQQTITAADKPGWCPLVSSASMSVSLAFLQNGCMNDGDCPLNQKCCLIYSGNYCVQPVQDGVSQPISSTAYNIPLDGQIGLNPFQTASFVNTQQPFCQLENEEYRQCGDHCEAVCSNIGRSNMCPGTFSTSCGPPGCYCRPGKSPSCMNDGQCPGESKCCPITDPSTAFNFVMKCLCVDPFAYFKECAPICPETCPNSGSTTLSKVSMCGTPRQQFSCEPGCACVDGYVKESYELGSSCVLLSRCANFGFLPQTYSRTGGGTQTGVARFTGGRSSMLRPIDGLISFEQSNENTVRINGQIRNLPQIRQKYSLQIVENAGLMCPSNPALYNNGRLFGTIDRFSNFDQQTTTTGRPLAAFTTDLQGNGRINGATNEIIIDNFAQGFSNNNRMKIPILNKIVGIFPFTRDSARDRAYKFDRALVCAYVTV